jgi:hypothetical protein
MKTNATINKLRRTVSIIAALSGLAVAAQAQTTIGSWQGYGANGSEGWIDWGNGQSITSAGNTAPAGAYSFVDSLIPGYDSSLQLQRSGWSQSLSIKLQNTPGDTAAFLDNHLLTFTFSVDAGAATSGFDQINTFIINAPGWGFNQVPWSDFTATGDQASNGNMPNFYFWGQGGILTQTVTVDYSSILPEISANPGYIEIIFTTNNGGGAPNYLNFNDVVLSGGPVPEPSTLALIGLGAASMLWLRRKNS